MNDWLEEKKRVELEELAAKARLRKLFPTQDKVLEHPPSPYPPSLPPLGAGGVVKETPSGYPAGWRATSQGKDSEGTST